MEILYLLVPVSVILVFAIGLAFWWSLKSGQYDDLEGPAYRILMDDDLPPAPARGDDGSGSESVQASKPEIVGDGEKRSEKNASV